MLTLIHSPQSRSSRFIWLLEELGAPYEIEYVTIRRMDGSGGVDPRNPQPEGKVPALVHDGVLMDESSAIALYLTDLFPDAGLGAPIGDKERGRYLSWLAWSGAEAEPAIYAKISGQAETDPYQAKRYEQVCARIQKAMEAGPYMMGERFTAVDILMFSAFQFVGDFLPQGENVKRYLATVGARSALARSLAKDAAPD